MESHIFLTKYLILLIFFHEVFNNLPFLISVTALQVNVKSFPAKQIVFAEQEWFRIDVIGNKP